MKLAIMQPYAFPYLGYFQLAAAADRFLLFDDVACSRCWINRNRLLDRATGEPWTFTIPLSGASRGGAIAALEIGGRPRWREKLLRRIEHEYAAAPHFATTWATLEPLLANPEPSLAKFLHKTVTTLFETLGIETELGATSELPYDNRALAGERRLVDICRREGASDYLNPEGGRELYGGANFAAAGVALHFVEHIERPYRQFGGDFVPRLSIIDAMMFCGPAELRGLLSAYRICPATRPSASCPTSNTPT